MTHSQLERVVAAAAAANARLKRRITIRTYGDVPGDVLRGVAVHDLVSTFTATDSGDLAVAWIDADLEHAAKHHKTAVVLYDPKATPPVEARRRVLGLWPACQSWVLPLEGPDAFSTGTLICGARNPSTPLISATMPVCNEEKDVERVLASFLPASAEWVVGVDEKSDDGTLAIVERYAEVVFRFRIEPWSFAEARNRCLERCTQPWIFMTEGHEHLDLSTMHHLIALPKLGADCGAVMVQRDTGTEAFFFPWISRNDPLIRYKDTGGVHNFLDTAPFSAAHGGEHATVTRLIGGTVRTIHKAHPVNRARRFEQRKGMNREALERHAEAGEHHRERALFYEMQEHASVGDVRKAARVGLRYLKRDKGFREQRYEGHLRVAEYFLDLGRPVFASWVLMRALPLEPQRAEAECLLGDAYLMRGDVESARQLYAKAAGVPMPDYSPMFLRKTYYREGPWKALAAASLELGHVEDAAKAARCALAFSPGDTVALDILARTGA